jgi:hypothetical protein
MNQASSLPGGFTALEPFVAQWSLSGTARRAAQRTASSPEAREAFFEAASPLLEAALTWLDDRDLATLPPAGRRLMDLMLSLGHVALAVEIQGPDEVKSAVWRDRMRIDRSTADQGISSCSN